MKKDCKARHHVNGKQLGSLEEAEADQPEGEEPSSADFGGLFFNSFEKLQPAASGGGGVSSQNTHHVLGPANTPSLSEAAGGDGVGVGGGDNGGADWGDPDLLVCACCPEQGPPVIPPRVNMSTHPKLTQGSSRRRQIWPRLRVRSLHLLWTLGPQ